MVGYDLLDYLTNITLVKNKNILSKVGVGVNSAINLCSPFGLP